MIKTIKFQQKVTIWQQAVAQFECPADESDAETFQRLRTEGPNESAIEWESTKNFDESEEAIPDDQLCANHTLEFDTGDSHGVIARDGVSCDPQGDVRVYTDEHEHEDFSFDLYQEDDDADPEGNYNDWVIAQLAARTHEDQGL